MSDELYELRINGMSEESAKAFTRAVPDVPELVVVAYGVDESNKGKPLVRYDQAAEIIAAKDKEIKRLRGLFKLQTDTHAEHIKQLNNQHEKELEIYGEAAKKFRNSAKAIEAKLAQYEAQEPVGYIIKHPRFTDDFQTYELSEGDISNGYTQVPIYASPAPSADLKEKSRHD